MAHSISESTCHIIRVPTHSRLDTTYGRAEAVLPHVLITVGDESGHLGIGEASPLPEFTGDSDGSIHLQLEQVFLPALIRHNPLDIDSIMARLDQLLPRNTPAKAAIDMALHDLVGKILGQPVYRLLGGLRRPDGFPVSRAIGIASVKETVAQALRWTNLGFRTLKIKVGTDPKEDVERVRAVQQEVPDGVKIRIDANQGYDVADAIKVLRALGGVIEYCEQPIAAWNLKGLRRIRDVTGVRVMADEAVHTAHDAMAVIDAQAADLIAIKLIKCGGLRAGRRIADVATLAGLYCVIVSPFETHVGASAGVHLALSLPPTPFADELSIFHVEPRGPYTTSCIATNKDYVMPPGQSGLGVELTRPISDFEKQLPQQ